MCFSHVPSSTLFRRPLRIEASVGDRAMTSRKIHPLDHLSIARSMSSNHR